MTYYNRSIEFSEKNWNVTIFSSFLRFKPSTPFVSSSLDRQLRTECWKKRENSFSQVLDFYATYFYLPYSLLDLSSEHRIGRVHWKDIIIDNNHEVVAQQYTEFIENLLFLPSQVLWKAPRAQSHTDAKQFVPGYTPVSAGVRTWLHICLAPESVY